MKLKSFQGIYLILSLPLAALIILVSIVGLNTPEFYSKETLNWQTQSLGQDTIDLFLIVPCLIISSILAYRNNKAGLFLWGGVVLYLCYTFTLYCFDVHFNKLFLIYCACLGISFYSVLYFLYRLPLLIGTISIGSNLLIRICGIYFIAIAVIFYLLWLSEIIPSITKSSVPESLVETGLFTNGVHVIDLSIFLPGVFITGLLLLKAKTLGFILTPVMLTFFVLMDITIGFLVIMMRNAGLESNLGLVIIMMVFTLISLVLLILYLKRIKIMFRSGI